MHPDLVAALAPVLADLAATCRVSLDVRDEDWGSPLGPAAMVWEPDDSGTGISIVSGEPVAEQVVSVADQVQEVAIEALWTERLPVTWPQCPLHPETHPLEAAVTEGPAIWRCPRSGTVVAHIGALGGG